MTPTLRRFAGRCPPPRGLLRLRPGKAGSAAPAGAGRYVVPCSMLHSVFPEAGPFSFPFHFHYQQREISHG